MEDVKKEVATINLLILNGAKFDLDKVRNVPGELVGVEISQLDTRINATPLSDGLHALTANRAEAGQEQTLDNAVEYVSLETDSPIVLKHQGRLLLLLGHKVVERSTKLVIKARLVSTVGLKNKAKIADVAAPVEPPKPAWTPPPRTYPSEFKNAPRIQSEGRGLRNPSERKVETTETAARTHNPAQTKQQTSKFLGKKKTFVTR